MGKAAQGKVAIADVVKAVGEFASDDVTRENLQHIEVTRIKDGVRLVTTNGHVLACVTVMDAAIALPIASQMTDGDTLYFRAKDAAARLAIAAPLIFVGKDVVRYPDWHQVVPKRKEDDEKCGIVALSPDYLALVGKTASKIAKACGARWGTSLRMQTGDALSPVRLDATMQGCDMIFVVMPMRM